MSEFRRTDALGNLEPKNTNGYIAKTVQKCPACAGPDRFLWIKVKRDDASDLECPVCDTVKTVARGTENLP